MARSHHREPNRSTGLGQLSRASQQMMRNVVGSGPQAATATLAVWVSMAKTCLRRWAQVTARCRWTSVFREASSPAADGRLGTIRARSALAGAKMP